MDGPPPAHMGVIMISAADIQIDRAELERRVADYTGTEQFQMELEALANVYREIGLPVPPYEVLRAGETTEVRKCMETLMVCEAKGHLWKERADPENGTSTLTCRRCGAEEYLRW